MGRENFVIKLTEKQGKEVANTVYINPSFIMALRPQSDGTMIVLGEKHGVLVIESIDQIQKKGGAYAVFKIIE